MASHRVNCVPLITMNTNPRLLDLLSAEPRWGEGEVCEECQVGFDIRFGAGGKNNFWLDEEEGHSGEIWADHQKTPLSPLWTPSLFKVQCQGDANNQVQPQQAGSD